MTEAQQTKLCLALAKLEDALFEVIITDSESFRGKQLQPYNRTLEADVTLENSRCHEFYWDWQEEDWKQTL